MARTSREALREYLKEWLARYRQATDIAPAVNDALAQIEWEIRALADIPVEARNLSTTELDTQAQEAFVTVQAVLPMIPEYSTSAAFQVSSTSTNTTSGVTSFVSDVGHLGFPAAMNYALRHLASYERLQETQHRPTIVRTGIEELFTGDTLARFDAAHRALQQSEIGTGTQSAAAMEIRTFLDGVQGQLFFRCPNKSSAKSELGSDGEATLQPPYGLRNA